MLLTPLFGRQQEMGDVTEHAGLRHLQRLTGGMRHAEPRPVSCHHNPHPGQQQGISRRDRARAHIASAHLAAGRGLVLGGFIRVLAYS